MIYCVLFILSCFSCGTTEKITVSGREITYCAVFACNSQCVFLCEVLVEFVVVVVRVSFF